MPTEVRERAESGSSSASLASAASSGASKNKRPKQSNNPSGRSKMRPVTVETVRKIVAQEGRSARNLISWNAPLEMEEKPKKSDASPVSFKSSKASRRPTTKRRSKSYDTGAAENKTTMKTNAESKTGKRQVSIRARYWAYLFENLRRAIDEIYATCETDQSVVECKEVLLVLDNYRHEFQALIGWMNLQEKLNSTDAANRPTSLAWEVRKSSPGRPRQRMTPRSSMNLPPGQSQSSAADSSQQSPSIKRTNSDKKTTSSTTVTWADRVKGVQQSGTQQQRSPRSLNRKVVVSSADKKSKNGEGNTVLQNSNTVVDDDEGWEKVSSKSKQSKNNRTQLAKSATLKNDGRNLSPKKSTTNVDENQNVTNYFGKATKSPNATTPTFCGMVSERSMGTSSTSYTDASVSENSLNKVLFEKEEACKEDDISLQTLDEVEAEFFKSEATLASDDEDAADMGSMDESNSNTNMALLEQHEASIAAAEHEEQQLMKEIEAEENAAIDTEPDTNTENETPTVSSTNITPRDSSDWNTIMARFEVDQEMHRGMTWGDMIDEEELREPGRAVQMHEKLSSPSRKSRTPAESKRKMEEKQRSATLRRQKMVQDKTERIHILTERVDVVKHLKADLIMGKTELLKELHIEKLQKAERQRDMTLQKIREKAQAEEMKVNEILFINELQEQNKRHDVMNRIQEHDARLQERLQEERLKMLEVKAAKEENVKERRRQLEKERLDRLSELIYKRKEHDSRIEQLKQEREKEREKQAREKERDRKTRLTALNAAQQEAVTELQKKIQIKHDESVRRHQEQLEQRKEKALELSLGRFSLSSSGNMTSGELQNSIYEGEKAAAQKFTSVSTSVDLSSIRGEEKDNGKGDASGSAKNANQENQVISPRNTQSEDKKLAREKEARMIERKKAMKKRAKKLKTRMSARGRDFLKTLDQKPQSVSSNKNKVSRLVKDINRQLATQKDTSGPWPANRVAALDRALGEIHRLLEKQDEASKVLFRTSGGFEMLEQVFEVQLNSMTFQGQKGESVSIVPDKTVANAAATFKSACEDNYDNVIYVLYSSRFTILVDTLTHQLTKHFPEDGPSSAVKSPVTGRKSTSANNKTSTQDDLFDPTASALLEALGFAVGFLASQTPFKDDGKLVISDNKNLLRALKSTSMTSSKPLPEMDPKKLIDGYLNRGLDVVSYTVSCGVLDKLSGYLSSVKSEIEANSKAAAFIKNGLSFLYAVTDFVALRNRINSDNAESRSRHTSTGSNASNPSCKAGEKPHAVISNSPFDPQVWDSDPTQLLPTLYHTEIMGIVSVLYGILLHGAPERPTLLRNKSMAAIDDVTDSSPPKKIPLHVLQIAMSVVLVLNALADLDIQLLQESLGAEGVSLEFRHICTYLLWYCQHGEYDGLLHEVIVCVGHFAICNKKNQETVHSGAMPTVLQQLCGLPFAYFSNPQLSNYLFPTLIACCHNNSPNLAMLEQEASSSLLSSYIKGILEDADKQNVTKTSERAIKYEGHLGIKRRETVALSSSRLYTVNFLRSAASFFDKKGDNDQAVILNGDSS